MDINACQFDIGVAAPFRVRKFSSRSNGTATMRVYVLYVLSGVNT